MKKILVITSGVLPVPPVEGGAVENLIQTYMENDDNNKFVVYSCSTDKEISNNKKNIEYRFIETKNKKFKVIFKIWRILNIIAGRKLGNYFVHKIKKDLKKRKDEYDLLLVENFPQYVLPFRKEFKDKIILHVHNDWLNKNSPKAQLIKKSCKDIYVVSNYIKGRVVQVDNDESNVKLLMNGIDNNRFTGKISESEKIEMQKKYGLNENDIIFMFSGKLNEQKGADILLESFIEVCANHSNVKLLLIGSSFNLNAQDSELVRKMKEKAQKIDNIIFTGFVDYDFIHKLYAIAEIQLVPSQFEDPCPLVVLEGLSSGNAMIVANSGGIPELVNENCAIIINRDSNFKEELTKAIEKLADNADITKNMQKESIKRSENFTNQKYIDRFKKLIEEE